MHDIESETLLRYVAGEATRHEAAAVEAWRSASPGNERELRVLAAAWQAATNAPETHEEPSSDWHRIEERLHGSAGAATGSRSAPVERRGVPASAMRLLRAAAIALLLAGGLLYALQRDTPTTIVAAAEAHETAAGETRIVALDEGSRVILGPSSRLTTRHGFGGDHRQVELEGTALFEVTHDPDRAFVVLAGGVRTTVLGTEFVVRAYEGDDAVDVAVVEGRVSVRADTEAEVSAGQSAHVENGIVRIGREDAAQLLAWRERRLAFRDATLRQAARELERWYDVDVVIADERLAQRRITMSMPATALDEVLALMQASLNVRVERTGDQVRFVP
jgi:transmembrane sensor